MQSNLIIVCFFVVLLNLTNLLCETTEKVVLDYTNSTSQQIRDDFMRNLTVLLEEVESQLKDNETLEIFYEIVPPENAESNIAVNLAILIQNTTVESAPSLDYRISYGQSSELGFGGHIIKRLNYHLKLSRKNDGWQYIKASPDVWENQKINSVLEKLLDAMETTSEESCSTNIKLKFLKNRTLKVALEVQMGLSVLLFEKQEDRNKIYDLELKITNHNTSDKGIDGIEVDVSLRKIKGIENETAASYGLSSTESNLPFEQFQSNGTENGTEASYSLTSTESNLPEQIQSYGTKNETESTLTLATTESDLSSELVQSTGIPTGTVASHYILVTTESNLPSEQLQSNGTGNETEQIEGGDKLSPMGSELSPEDLKSNETEKELPEESGILSSTDLKLSTEQPELNSTANEAVENKITVDTAAAVLKLPPKQLESNLSATISVEKNKQLESSEKHFGGKNKKTKNKNKNKNKKKKTNTVSKNKYDRYPNKKNRSSFVRTSYPKRVEKEKNGQSFIKNSSPDLVYNRQDRPSFLKYNRIALIRRY